MEFNGIQACVILYQGYILKIVVQIEIAQIIHKIPIQKSVFPGHQGLTTLTYAEYDNH